MLVIAATSMAAAANTDLDINPSPIGPDSQFYGVQIGVQNAFVDWGIIDPGGVVHQRASDAYLAAQRNDTAAVNRSIAAMNQVAAVASGTEETRLQSAQAVLEAVQGQVPDEAQPGIETAINTVIEAQNRFPADVPDRIPDERPATGVAG